MARSRRRHRAGWSVLLVAAAVLVPPGGHPSAQAEVPRPNILLITADDMAVGDLSAMPVVQSELVGKGTTYTSGISTFPLCCPAHASILTGQYAHNHGVLGNGGGLWPIGGYPQLDSTNTVPVWLSAAGYQTAFVGKPMVGYNRTEPLVVPPGWAEWHAVIDGDYSRSTMFEDGLQNRYDEYQTDLWAAIDQDVLHRRLPDDAPLFLWASFKAPHNAGPVETDDPPHGPTPARADRHRGLLAGTPLPMDPSFDEEDVSDKPAEVQAMPRLDQMALDYLAAEQQQRLESLLALDEAVGALLAALAAAGELANTLIVFTSDNGYLMGQHRYTGGKGVPYEPSIRVPLVARGPGVPIGGTVDGLAGTVDLAPTFVEVAGATAGLTMDGVSLLEPRPRTLVIEAGPREIGAPYYWTGIRTQRLKYVEWGTGEVELYDLTSDPYELQNLAGDPWYAELEADAAALLADLRDCVGVACQAAGSL